MTLRRDPINLRHPQAQPRTYGFGQRGGWGSVSAAAWTTYQKKTAQHQQQHQSGGGSQGQSGNSGSGTPAPTGSDTNGPGAYDLLVSWFSQYGIDVGPDLEQVIKDLMTQYGDQAVSNIDLFMPEIEKTQSFQKRFPGYSSRIANGYNALSLGDYINLEDQYHRILQQAGLPKGFYDDPSDFGNWIANDVSPDEISARVQDATALAQQVDPTMRNLMAKYYGLTTGDIASYFLDQRRALPTLTRQYNASQIATAAAQSGISINGMSRYEDLVDKGVTGAQARQGYPLVNQLTKSVGELASIYGDTYDQTDAENDVFFGQDQKRNKLVNQEQATFGGKGRAANTGSAQRQSY